MFSYLILIATAYLVANAAETDVNYRLNTPIKPKSYAITITPYFDTGNTNAFTFDGEVSIIFTTDTETNQIKLHSENLTFSVPDITLTTVSGNTKIDLNTTDPLLFDTKYTFAFINLKSNLLPNTEYSLKIVFKGPIREDLKGFYRNYYIENGNKKWLGATQMEPTHARKVFPCFDEPDLKASFKIIIDRPSTYQPSRANTLLESSTNLNNGYVREVFHETPVMSTYLVAFLVSEFTATKYSINGTKEFGIWTRPEAGNQSAYAFEIGLKVVDALSDYFGIDYYSTNGFLKLDHVALVDFSAGAMENWGLVKYREALLLYVPNQSTPFYKYRVAQIIAHETTHMWFGNLVTCHWWSNTWLNEGFANYFQDYITAMVDPDVGSADILVTGSVYDAYNADDTVKAVPISNDKVNSPAEISAHFGTITYQKAGSVIRMMHHLLGDDAFKRGLHSYLSANQFKPGYPNYLYSALEEGANATGALDSYPGFTITDIMSSWIHQAGHPLLQVDVDYSTGTISMTQKRFYANHSEKSDEIYKIPITYTTGTAPNFNNTKPSFIMADKTHTFNISNLQHNWIIFNVQETGLYRVNYDLMTWNHIVSAMNGADREKIHPLNRAKIINDLFALFFADELMFDFVYTALKTLREENDYNVWYATVQGLSKLRSRFLGTSSLSSIDTSMQMILNYGINQVGYSVNPDEGTVALRNRMQILELACKVGHSGCTQAMTELFRKFRDDGEEITPSLRPVAYCQGLRSGDGKDYDFLWKRMASTNVANEARVIGGALGCTTNEEKLKTFLQSMKEAESPIRTQDLDVPLAGVLSHYENVPLVLEELKENYNLWKDMYPSMDSPLNRIASALRTEEEISEFENWLTACRDCTEEALTAARESLINTKDIHSWAEDHRDGVLAALRDNAVLMAPSLTLLSLTVAIAACHIF